MDQLFTYTFKQMIIFNAYYFLDGVRIELKDLREYKLNKILE